MIAPTGIAQAFAAEAERHRAEAEFHREQGERHRHLADRYDTLASEPWGVVDSLHARFWTLPAQTRLTTQQVAEVCGKTRSWVFKQIDARRTKNPLPYRREGSGARHRLIFLAGELRSWLQERELVVRRGSMGIDDVAARRNNP